MEQMPPCTDWSLPPHTMAAFRDKGDGEPPTFTFVVSITVQDSVLRSHLKKRGYRWSRWDSAWFLPMLPHDRVSHEAAALQVWGLRLL